MIIDITGVLLIDTAVANHLILATQGIALLGARTILVGVSPELRSEERCRERVCT